MSHRSDRSRRARGAGLGPDRSGSFFRSRWVERPAHVTEPEPTGLAPDEFMRFLVADIDKYRKLAQRINLKIE